MNSKLPSYLGFSVLIALTSIFSGCSRHISGRDSRSSGEKRSFEGRNETGFASWYGDQFHGKQTASGETYDMYSMTAAHRHAPFGTNVRVTNLDNGNQTTVKINDRGPFVRGRIIDLSKKAAQEIGMVGNGTAKVKLEFLDRQPIVDSYEYKASTGQIFIQTASFGSEANAQNYLNTLKQSLPSVTARIYNENNLFRVRAGPYTSVADAETDVRLLKKSNFDGLILHTD